MLEALINQFAQLEDPHCDWRVEHKLIDILVIAVCAVIGEAESFEDIALYGRCKRDWLQRFLELPGGIPSHDTFRRVLMLIDPDCFERCFLGWVRAVFQPDAAAPRQIAIDGKTVRRSFDRKHGCSPLHLVSAFATEQGLVLAQRAVANKGGELAVLPDLLDGLDLRGCLVSLDALACQPAVAERVVSRGGDYLITLKGNQKKTHAEVKDWFAAHAFAPGAPLRPCCDAFDQSHGRLVRRRVFVCPEAARLEALQAWPGLHTVLAIETIRSVNGSGRIEAEVRYFLSSCSDDPAVLVTAIRRHWSIENNLLWVLDVTFREDDSRVRERTAARNLAVLRKIALNLLAADQATRTSVRGRRKKAAWNDAYMHRLIFG